MTAQEPDFTTPLGQREAFLLTSKNGGEPIVTRSRGRAKLAANGGVSVERVTLLPSPAPAPDADTGDLQEALEWYRVRYMAMVRGTEGPEPSAPVMSTDGIGSLTDQTFRAPPIPPMPRLVREHMAAATLPLPPEPSR